MNPDMTQLLYMIGALVLVGGGVWRMYGAKRPRMVRDFLIIAAVVAAVTIAVVLYDQHK